MSPKNALLVAGLVGVGLAGVTSHSVADRPASTAPAVSSPAPSPTTVLLLSNGQMVSGVVTETDDGYLVKTPIGVLPFKRSLVERGFSSLQEVYQYKAARLPERDSEERMKLVQWCLGQHLQAEGREQLELVVKQNPNNARAKAMLFRLQANADEMASARDQAVVRTGAEAVDPPATPRTDQPATLNSNTLHELRDRVRNNPGGVGRPVIFDLPQPQAIKRYQEFTAYVHPALQRACASCHNEQSNSTFQLVQARSKRDLDNELLVRANLDATLRLIDPTDPARSLLLSSAIMPHRPDGRPRLTGPNDPTYRLLLSWANTLHSPTATPLGQARAASADPKASVSAAPESAFAADRLKPPIEARAPVGPAGAPADAAVAPAAAQPTIEPDSVTPTPPGQMLPGSAVGLPKTVPPPEDFRTPPLLGGPNPAAIKVRTPKGAAQTPTPKAAAGEPVVLSRLKDGSQIIKMPDGSQCLRLRDGTDVPIADVTKSDPTSKGKTDGATAADGASKKPPRIDTDKLQQFMMGGGK